MNLVDDERVLRQDVAILEPAARDAGGDDHHVPRRRFRRGLAFAVHDTDAQIGGAKDRLGDRTNGEGLAAAGAGHDAKAFAARRQAAHIGAPGALEIGLNVQPHRELDGLAGRAGGGDDDHAPGGRLGGRVGLAIGG